ncbi:hypothetical protein KKC06_01155 [Patescibacteria group bacterium]|nr:hypothetical protein [Patescibacteria group bacterium]
MSKARLFGGSCIILFGVLLLLSQFGININFGNIWPIAILIPGLFFWILFLSKKDKSGGVLIPGTILVVYSLYFFFNQVTDYEFAGQTSFVFIIGVSLGFFAAYFLPQKKEPIFLVPAWILLAISIFILLITVFNGSWWPILIIILGIWLLFKNYKKDHLDNNEK